MGRNGVQLRQQFISESKFVVILGGWAGFVYSSIRLYRASRLRNPSLFPKIVNRSFSRSTVLPRGITMRSPRRNIATRQPSGKSVSIRAAANEVGGCAIAMQCQ